MAPQVQIHPSSVFVASGGAKGITAQCVKIISQHFSCKCILLRRSQRLKMEPVWAKDCFDESDLKKRIMDYLLAQGEKPTPVKVEQTYKEIASTREITRTLQALEQAGSEAEYISVDITDGKALKDKLSDAIARLGTVSGIIHGAGNLADKLIEKKTDRDFNLVYDPKVRGLENLLGTVDPKQLKYLILFSSVTGFYGNPGQTDYAIANEILTKSAHVFKQKNPQCHVAAINWGAWDSGMVSPELKKAFEMNNVRVLPVDGGTQMLLRELDDSHHQCVQSIIGSALPKPVSSLGSKLWTHRLHRQLSLEANPFLTDHQIGGYPVLPATCAMSWIAGSCEQLYPGYKFFSLNDFRILKGISFDATLENTYTLQLEEVSKSKVTGIELVATIFSENSDGKIRYHFKARSKLLPTAPKPPNFEAMDLSEDAAITGTRQSFYKDDGMSLFHGPLFRGIDKILNISPNKITAKLYLNKIDGSIQGQFQPQAFNPIILDAELHPAWVWLQHFHQSGALPARFGCFEQFTIPPYDEYFYVTFEIVSKTPSSLVTNMTTYDERGEIYSRASEAVATVIPLPISFRKK